MTDWYSFYQTRRTRTVTGHRVYDRSTGFTTVTSTQRHYNWDTGRLPTGVAIDQAYQRQGFVDTRQPMWGWFAGGGWAFGRVENATHRFSVETYQAYRNTPVDGELTLRWAESDVTGATTVRTETLIVGRDIPAFSSLRTLDVLKR